MPAWLVCGVVAAVGVVVGAVGMLTYSILSLVGQIDEMTEGNME